MKPEEVQLKPTTTTRETDKLDWNEALGTGGKGWRMLLTGLGVAMVACAAWLLASGIPTGIIETPFYARMTPVEWWDYPFWIVNSVLAGFLTATYLPVSRKPSSSGGRVFGGGLGGGLLTVFAVGCPVCNKLVVLALGFGGAMTYFAPVQPLLGLISTGLLLYGLRLRLSDTRSCRVGPSVAGRNEERPSTG